MGMVDFAQQSEGIPWLKTAKLIEQGQVWTALAKVQMTASRCQKWVDRGI